MALQRMAEYSFMTYIPNVSQGTECY